VAAPPTDQLATTERGVSETDDRGLLVDVT
jgi:hypothetical protein